MVNIAFTPALGDAIQVPISDCCDELDTVAVRFAAVLGYQEYRQVVEGHLKVQVWSDIASPDVQGWRAYDFEVPPGSASQQDKEGPGSSGAVSATGISDNRVVLRPAGTSSSSGERRSSHDDGSQRLEASVRVSVRNARNFSFTYRVVYSSGDIEWLGTYGHNGYAEVIRENLKGLNLSKGWSEAGRIFTLDGTNDSPVTIAAFDNVEEYDIWAFPRGLSSLDRSSEGEDAELLLAIPRQFGVYTRNPSYVIHASPGAVMHLDTSAEVGSLQAYGSGNIMVHACYDLSRLQSLLHLRPLQYGGRVELKVLPEDDGSAPCLVVSSSSSSRGRTPIKVVLIPIAPTLHEVEVRVGIDALAQGLGDQVALVSGTTTDVHFLSGPFVDQTCTFVVPKHGGEFLLSPVHDFGIEKDASDACQIAFLTPHSDVTQALEGLVVLPTPPPSPQIQMLKKPQVSFSKRAELIPTTPPTSHHPQQSATPARELRKRRQASSVRAIPTSSSDESLQSDLYPDSDSSPASKKRSGEPAGPTNLFTLLYFFAWARYLILLLKFVLGGGLGEWRRGQSKDVKVIASIPEKQVLHDFPQEEEDEISATPESSSVSSTTSQSSSAESDDEPSGVQEIHAPKPSLPSQHVGSQNKALRVFYADLCLPSPSPFTPSSSDKKREASLILSIQGQDPLSGQESISMSNLCKVLTVNGEVPVDLEVTVLSRRGDAVAKSNSGVHHLVRFSLPSGVDGARLRIAETL